MQQSAITLAELISAAVRKVQTRRGIVVLSNVVQKRDQEQHPRPGCRCDNRDPQSDHFYAVGASVVKLVAQTAL